MKCTATDLQTCRELADALRPVFARHPEVALAYLFGSVARGATRPDSDLDLGLVLRRRGETAVDHVELIGRLAYEAAQASGREPVDLVLLESQGPIFCHHVLREGALLYVADEARRVDFESETILRAIDFRPTYELATRGKPAALRQWLRARRDVR